MSLPILMKGYSKTINVGLETHKAQPLVVRTQNRENDRKLQRNEVAYKVFDETPKKNFRVFHKVFDETLKDNVISRTTEYVESASACVGRVIKGAQAETFQWKPGIKLCAFEKWRIIQHGFNEHGVVHTLRTRSLMLRAELHLYFYDKETFTQINVREYQFDDGVEELPTLVPSLIHKTNSVDDDLSIRASHRVIGELNAHYLLICDQRAKGMEKMNSVLKVLELPQLALAIKQFYVRMIKNKTVDKWLVKWKRKKLCGIKMNILKNCTNSFDPRGQDLLKRRMVLSEDDEIIVKGGSELIEGTDREDKWRKLNVRQLELYAKRMKLIGDQLTVVIQDIKLTYVDGHAS
ncbi:hypothetical protein Tco_0585044 [Tanacetum coccineum]